MFIFHISINFGSIIISEFQTLPGLSYMFNPITITYLNDQLNKIDWMDRIYRLDSYYMFKFNISKLISSPLSPLFYSFARTCLQFIAMKVYSPLLQIKDMVEWNQELESVCQKIKTEYCNLINKIRNNKKVYVMDVMIFVITLLSRDFLGNFFDRTKKKTIGIDKKTNQTTKNGNEILKVEQYTFIILTYETTGNIVSPQAFQVIKKRLSEHRNALLIRHESLDMIAQTLKSIRDQYEKKMTIIKSLESYPQEQSIESALKILDNFEYYEEKYQKKSNSKKDKVSNQLCQILEISLENQPLQEPRNYARLQKINHLSLSRAVRAIYKPIQKDQTLLQRTSRKYESLDIKKQRKSCWKKIKHINKPIIHIKNRRNLFSPKPQKDQQKDWIKIMHEIRKVKKLQIQTQKFKSFSSNNSLQIEKNYKKNLPQILSNVIPSYIQCRPGRLSLKQRHSKSLANESQRQTKITPQSYKLKTFDDGISKKRKLTDITKLKKKVIDIKNQQRMFEQKCQQRKKFIESINF